MVDRERFLVVLMMMMLFPKRQDAFLDRYFLFKVSNLIPFFYVMKGKKDDHHHHQTTPQIMTAFAAAAASALSSSSSSAAAAAAGGRWCSRRRAKKSVVEATTSSSSSGRERRLFHSLKKALGEERERINGGGKIGPTAAEPTAVDAQTFNELVALGAWDKIVPECKRLATIGKITDGVLGQAYIVLTACKEQGEDENVLKTLENIIQLLTQTLLQLEADSPARRALDEMMTLNPDEVFNGRLACQEIIERNGSNVDDVVLELQQFLQNCELQDAAFERDLALATDTDNREEFDRLTALVTAKLEAKRRTLALLGYMGISE